MLNFIKLFLIPHEHNGFRPRILEMRYFLVVIIAVIILKILSVTSFYQYLGATIFGQVSQGDLYTLTNSVRGDNKLPALAVNSQLQMAAELKLADMSANQYFGHVSPGGVTPWTWFDKAGYSYLVAGENLAMDFSSSQDVMQAWLNSPAHRKNIILPDFTQIGIAVGKITIDGRSRIAVVQEFGKPEIIAVKKAKSTTPAKKPVTTVVPTPQTIATTFRTQPSQPIKSAVVKTPLPQVRGAETTIASYFAFNGLNIIIILVLLASVVIAILNIAIARHIQFPALIMRSAVLVGICILAFAIKDYQLLGNHVIIP